jgi:hypothetical protein
MNPMYRSLGDLSSPVLKLENKEKQNETTQHYLERG